MRSRMGAFVLLEPIVHFCTLGLFIFHVLLFAITYSLLWKGSISHGTIFD